MNKQLKLRIWDKSTKQWLKNPSITFASDGSICEVESDYYVSLDNIDISQSTGLLDRNHMEIWEGDIVAFDRPLYIKEKQSDGSVIYNGIRITEINGSVYFSGGDFSVYSTDGKISNEIRSLYEIHGRCDVIGNIYENPELLER